MDPVITFCFLSVCFEKGKKHRHSGRKKKKKKESQTLCHWQWNKCFYEKNATKKTALLPLSDPRINICNNRWIYLKDKALWHSYNSVGHHSSAEREHSHHVHLCLFWYRNFMQLNTMKKKAISKTLDMYTTKSP